MFTSIWALLGIGFCFLLSLFIAVAMYSVKKRKKMDMPYFTLHNLRAIFLTVILAIGSLFVASSIFDSSMLAELKANETMTFSELLLHPAQFVSALMVTLNLYAVYAVAYFFQILGLLSICLAPLATFFLGYAPKLATKWVSLTLRTNRNAFLGALVIYFISAMVFPLVQAGALMALIIAAIMILISGYCMYKFDQMNKTDNTHKDENETMYQSVPNVSLDVSIEKAIIQAAKENNEKPTRQLGGGISL